MRSGIAKPGEARLDDGRDSGEAERRKRHGDQSQQGHLHFRRPDLIANIFRDAADHKSGEKDGDNAEHQHAEEGGTGRASDVDLLMDVCDNLSPGINWPPQQTTICVLGPSIPSSIASGIRMFRDEFLQHVTEGGCPYG